MIFTYLSKKKYISNTFSCTTPNWITLHNNPAATNHLKQNKMPQNLWKYKWLKNNQQKKLEIIMSMIFLVQSGITFDFPFPLLLLLLLLLFLLFLFFSYSKIIYCIYYIFILHPNRTQLVSNADYTWLKIDLVIAWMLLGIFFPLSCFFFFSDFAFLFCVFSAHTNVQVFLLFS